MLLGAHVSTSGGVKNAPQNGKNIGCDVLQIFSKNQQQWAAKPLDADQIEGYRSGMKTFGFGPTLVHCSYLLNLASSDDALWEKSVAGLVNELERAEQLAIPYVVFHPGSPKDKGEAWGCTRVAEGVTRALAATKGAKVMILLENNAGAGAAIGDTIDELASVLAQVRGDTARVGVCIDTCHAFVSGYPIHTEEGYDAFVTELEEKIGLARVKAFHLNDSKFGINSKKDRHEHMGLGMMGDVPFWKLVTDARFRDVPGYLETPFETEADYVNDLAYLRDLASGKRKPKPAPKVGQQTLFGDAAAAATKAPPKPAGKPAANAHAKKGAGSAKKAAKKR